MPTGEDRQDLLLEAGLALTSELSLPTVLQRIVELAARLTDARYGALGVMGPDDRILEFVTTGVSDEERRAIGDPPEGHGILGVLIEEGETLRLPKIADHPRSLGFPANHPRMESFLGAPVKARGKVFGNIYLAEKRGAPEFTEGDERALIVLATQAGVAVANAHLYQEALGREQRLDAAREIATSILEGTDPNDALRLVAQRARELVGADAATIAVPDTEVGAGTVTLQVADGLNADKLRGMTFPAGESISFSAEASLAPVVLEDASKDPLIHQPLVELGRIGPAMLVPLIARDRAVGMLLVANELGGRQFRPADVELVESFAQQATIALEYARAQQDLRRLALMEDRERIARELHDGVIQSLFAVGMGLQGTVALAGSPDLEARLEGAVEELDRVIRDLRNYIFGLRPGILADRQLDQALRDLVRDFEEKSNVVTVIDVDARVASELSSRAGDIVQVAREALSNVGRHARASTVRVSLGRWNGEAVLEVDDDGSGFDPGSLAETGDGLRNIRERSGSLGGSVEVTSVPGEGTTVRVTIPI